MRKETSTNSINETYLNSECGMAYFLSVIGGRWKLSILGFLLQSEKLRYSELKRKLVGISERMLVAQLKELEDNGLIQRIVYPQVPPKVEYRLTKIGYSLEKILTAMSEWGEDHRPK
jgi:DNA-binding HxlR family transcriptional regulator